MDDRKDLAEPKRGYLNNDFEFFHLKDQKNIQFEYHYHDFNKITVFISGNVTYLIEGKAYNLKPWDILLVNSREIHKPIIDPECIYERIVIWANPAYLEKHSTGECNLSTCFELAAGSGRNLLRSGPNSIKHIRNTLQQLEDANRSSEFGSRILKNSLFTQLIVRINREFLGTHGLQDPDDIKCDKEIDGIISYINANLDGDLSIEDLSAKFFMSKYYLMHRFKLQTGYSLHSYILQKRLIAANTLIRNGKPAAEVCGECGFGDYSSFVRAFKKMFGLSPKNYYKTALQIETAYKNGRHFD